MPSGTPKSFTRAFKHRTGSPGATGPYRRPRRRRRRKPPGEVCRQPVDVFPHPRTGVPPVVPARGA
ncbi:hypothetical protein F0344_27060 [Streptomyces finlayi]|uniref:Uncharacterized protein n=1 Tax=Streptomyces finlayi TaxID=67296 RepID=A0A7G7BR01_9ACTN|nr:hypothetical protein F0344_27060 [Streptomyces finlayi]